MNCFNDFKLGQVWLNTKGNFRHTITEISSTRLDSNVEWIITKDQHGNKYRWNYDSTTDCIAIDSWKLAKSGEELTYKGLLYCRSIVSPEGIKGHITSVSVQSGENESCNKTVTIIGYGFEVAVCSEEAFNLFFKGWKYDGV